ncbi:hypothetical protein Ctob_010730 [Chrysochromulina tobinii]|uniref:Uncharacterized protein n=1 Tax=Chrysochromulina tobinii TaxID=1460289 RepID=A0A0M0KAA0_9EUKA|nr:hypothetical protein Ctob_010730 [Chrysochromulina tobinii]|eukprot:KOO35343.1 hypothetical protein Ctob_010730 [Chrysochromulina sp. CCMP291]
MSASDMDMDGMEIEEEPDKGNDEGFYQSTIRLLNPSPPVQHIDPDEFPMVCSSSSLFNARTHNWIVAGIGISMQLAIGFTPHLAQAAELLGWESIPSNCSISEAALVMRCDVTMSTTPTCNAAAPMSNDLFIVLILRRAAFHAGQSLLHYALVALFIPDLFHAAVVMVTIAALNCARAQYLWKQAFCINLLAATLPSHVTSIAVALAACHQQRQLVRRQLLLQKQLQVAKDIRIEQLQCEKERLDFDRKAALQRKRAMEDSFKSSAASDAGCSTVASSVYDPAQAMKTDD